MDTRDLIAMLVTAVVIAVCVACACSIYAVKTDRMVKLRRLEVIEKVGERVCDVGEQFASGRATSMSLTPKEYFEACTQEKSK